MSISTRKIGALVPCAICGAEVLVPAQDDTGPARSREPIQELVFAPPAEPEPQQALASPEFPPVSEPLPQKLSSATSTLPPVEPADESEDEDVAPLVLRSRRFNEEELDLTAMVDVVFQLLIFFMVTASFSLQKSIEVPTPDQPKQGVARALQPLEDLQDVAILVAVDDSNSVSVDDEPVADLSQLPDVLSAHMRRDRKSEMIVTASRNATHRTVISVIDAANEVGMQRIRLGTSRLGEN